MPIQPQPCSGLNKLFMERSVYIIKPEAIAHRHAIRAIIVSSGLRIVSSKTVMLGPGEVDRLYVFTDQDLRSAAICAFKAGPCEMGIVEGRDAIAKLTELAGSSTNPAKCEKHSIRATFGVTLPVRVGHSLYYLNGFHRSRDAAEANDDLELYEGLKHEHGTSRNDSYHQ